MPKGVYQRKSRAPKSYPAGLVAMIQSLYEEEDMTQQEIAGNIGETRRIVEKAMRRHNIPRRRQAKRDQRGERNATWRGDQATYAAFHYRVYAVRGQPMYCEDCGTTNTERRYQWASLTRNYADPMDYRRLCEPCHSRFDAKARNLGAYAVRKECPVP